MHSQRRSFRKPQRRAASRERSRRRLAVESLEARNLLATFVVTNTGDAGPGSLQEALVIANTTPNTTGPDVIEFDIPGAGPHTIQLRNPLPAIDEAVVIDGYTQPGASPNSNPLSQGTNAALQIELDGSLLTGGDGLVISGRGQQSTITGLAINRFPGAAILINSSNGNTIRGNFLGTNLSGNAAAPNALDGVHIADGSQNRIGGPMPADRNLISGNTGRGVFVEALTDAAQNVIQGNLIGTANNGRDPLGNGGDGILLSGTAGTFLGAIAAPDAGNVIAHNNGSGVSVVGDIAMSNAIFANSIFANQQLAIDLGRDGSTPNDANDLDQGPNALQNFPVLTAATSDAASTTISGSLTSLPDADYRIEFFASVSVSATGQAQAEQFLGATNVIIASGQTSVNFANVVVPVPVPRGHQITATATSPKGDTSELSAPLAQQTNHNPVAVDDMFAADEDTPLSVDPAISLLGNDTDIDGDSLAVVTADTLSQRGAAVDVQPDGSFSYDPTNAASLQAIAVGDMLTDSFTYQLGDMNGGAATGTVNLTVTGVNDAPIAADVMSFAFEDGPAVTLPFRADDIDADDDPAPLVYMLSSSPAEGTATNNNDGTFSFDPANGFQDLSAGETRSVTFTYVAVDRHGASSNTASVTIAIVGVNDAPMFNLSGGPTVLEDAGAQSFAGFASTIDAGTGDTGQLVTIDTTLGSTTGSLVFTLAPAINSTSGDLTFETAVDANGTAEVVVQLNDNGSVGGPIVLTFPAGGGNVIQDGETFSISETGSGATTTFEFDNDLSSGSGNQPIAFDFDSNISDIVNSFIAAAANAGLMFSPVDLGGGNILAVASSDDALINLANGPSLTQTQGPNGQNVSAPQTFTINITAVNDAPVLNSGVMPSFAPVRVDGLNNSGTLISSLVNQSGNLISDVDAEAVEGLAIIATTGLGDWEFSTDGGATFSPFGSLAESDALLLRETDVIRYQPLSTVVVGSPDMPSMTFRAWDQTSNNPDTTQNGESTAFSEAAQTVAVQVALTLAELRERAGDAAAMDLVIADAASGGKADLLQLSLDTSGTQLVITDNSNVVGDFTGTAAAANSVQIPIARITSGVIQIDLGDGSDALEIDFSNAPAAGINLSLVINGGAGNDELKFVNSVSLGGGSISMNGQIEDVFVLGAITTRDEPVTLNAARSVEIHANIATGTTGGPVQINSGHDILGANCAMIDAGDAPVSLNGATGIANIGVRTTGGVLLTSTLGGISGCDGATTVQAQSLTINSLTAVGGALLDSGTLSVIAPMRVDVNELHGSAGGLGIFLVNPHELTVDDSVATSAAPFGRKVISIVPPVPAAPLSEGESSPWQNQRDPLDVNDDSFVSPLDALATINFLVGAASAGAGEAGAAVPIVMYPDVNGDRFVSAVDALQVINHLNAADTIFAAGELAVETSSGREQQAVPISIDLPRQTLSSTSVRQEAAGRAIKQSALNETARTSRTPLASSLPSALARDDRSSRLGTFSSTDLELALDELSSEIAERWYLGDN